MAMFVHSSDLEVQERAVSSHQLLRYVLKQQQKNEPCGPDVAALFGGEINPVTNKAQRKVPVPEGLDLDVWINEPPMPVSTEILDSDDEESVSSSKNDHKKKKKRHDKKPRNKMSGLFVSDTNGEKVDRVEPTEEELEQMRNMRLKEQEANPHYLKVSAMESPDGYINLGDDLPPIEQIENIIGADKLKKIVNVHKSFPSSEYYLQQDKMKQEKEKKQLEKKNKKNKKRKNVEQKEDEDDIQVHHVVKSEFDVPGGTNFDKDDLDKSSVDLTDPHRLLNIDLDKPLTDADKFPIQKHRITASNVSKPSECLVENKTKTKKSKERKTKSKKEIDNNINEENEKSSKKHKKDKKSNKSKSLKTDLIEVIPENIAETSTTADDAFSSWLDNDKPVVEKKRSSKKGMVLSNLIPSSIDMTEFANLLSSGSLPNKCTVKVKHIKVDKFQSCVKFLCKRSRLLVVEEIQNTASLYGKDVEGSHVCLLVKMINEGSSISIEAKSNSDQLVNGVTNAIKHLIRDQYSITAVNLP